MVRRRMSSNIAQLQVAKVDLDVAARIHEKLAYHPQQAEVQSTIIFVEFAARRSQYCGLPHMHERSSKSKRSGFQFGVNQNFATFVRSGRVSRL